jgi:hypothetical protein
VAGNVHFESQGSLGSWNGLSRLWKHSLRSLPRISCTIGLHQNVADDVSHTLSPHNEPERVKFAGL